jgi:hypothetical protein
MALSFERPDSLSDEGLTGFFAPFAQAERAEAVQEYVAGMDNAVRVPIRGDRAHCGPRASPPRGRAEIPVVMWPRAAVVG